MPRETEHDAYAEHRRQCDSLIAEMADLQAERDKAQAACAAMRELAQFLFVMWFGELPEVLTREMESVDFERFGNIIKAPHPWQGGDLTAEGAIHKALDAYEAQDPGQPLLAELKQLRALRQAVLAFQAVERSWVRGNDVPWGEAVDKALDVMYSAALAAKESKP